MKRIPLYGRGKTVRAWVMVDDEDYDWLMQWRWNIKSETRRKTFYATRNGYDSEGERKTSIRMHREVATRLCGLAVHAEIDHRNGNGLDNQRHNLRPCSRSQNQGNRGANTNNKSGYKGVSWYKRRQKWRTCIAKDGGMKEVGVFSSAEEAAHAYDKAAIERWGEFALLNFPAASSEEVT